jgi:hypothetical protein
MARVQQQHEERLRRYIPVEYVILMFNRLADALRKRVQDDALMADKRAFMDAVADDFDRIATTVMVDPKEQKALPEPYEPQDVAGLLALPWIKNLQCAQGIIRFSQRQDLLVMYLMAEYERHGGVASYVVAMMDQEMPGIPVSDEG